MHLQEKADETNKYFYDLFAMANHVGSLNGGHYYADIKSFEDQQWYRFNDSSVQMIKKVNYQYFFNIVSIFFSVTIFPVVIDTVHIC